MIEVSEVHCKRSYLL